MSPGLAVLAWGGGAWLQAGQIKLMQPFGDGARMHLDMEAPRQLGLQIDAAPAHHAMDLRVRPGDHQFLQFRPLVRC